MRDNFLSFLFWLFLLSFTNQRIDAQTCLLTSIEFTSQEEVDRFPHEYVILIEEPIDQEITKAIGSLNYYINNDKLEVQEDDW